MHTSDFKSKDRAALVEWGRGVSRREVVSSQGHRPPLPSYPISE